MIGYGACNFSFDTKVRTLEPVVAEKEQAQFFVGTNTLTRSNHIHLVQVNDDANDVIIVQSFCHSGEVLSLAPSPYDRHLLVTCGKPRGQMAAASLWKTPEVARTTSKTLGQDDNLHLETNHMMQELEQLATFPAQKLPLSEIVWNAAAETCMLASVHETLLCTWQLDGGGGEVEAQHKLQLDVSMLGNGMKVRATALTWDPHHISELTFALGGSVRLWDLRDKRDHVCVEDAHANTTLSLDYNPNKPFAIATGGDDGKLKFWDLRNAHKPLLALQAHSHWVWSTRYHPQHDQLILSGGSDATVALWRVSSISSSPLFEPDERDLMDKTAGGASDTLVRRIEDHDDAVYSARWAAGEDAWVFVSVSYDGCLAINQVPSTEKYKILL